jgi:hypothetical protein
MTAFEDVYHLIFPDPAPGAVILEAKESTAKRPYNAFELVPGKPLAFKNGFAKEDDARGVPERLTDIVFDGVSFAVRDALKEQLSALPIDGLQFYPMTYLSRSGLLHTDYWYANLFKEQPFLDRERSSFIPDPEGEEDERPWALRFALDSRAMASVTEDARLIFRLDGVMNAYLFVHDRILALLRDTPGWVSFRVSEFHEGMQHRG